MTQSAKVVNSKGQEPSMEEILASIRRIIADDESPAAPAAKQAPADPKPQPPPAAPAAPAPAADASAANSQDDIDALFASMESAPGAEAAPEPAPADDVLELTEEMAVSEETAQSALNADDVEFTEPAGSDTVPSAPSDFGAPSFATRETASRFDNQNGISASGLNSSPMNTMLSQQTASAVESAFNNLASTVLTNNARTLEDLVKEMLRPMLKSWLDDNLPTLVERIVRNEIERVSRGR